MEINEGEIMLKKFLRNWYDKWNPSILMWDVCLTHKEDGTEQHFFFLFHWAAHLFTKVKCDEMHDEYYITIGGEPLWLI